MNKPSLGQSDFLMDIDLTDSSHLAASK